MFIAISVVLLEMACGGVRDSRSVVLVPTRHLSVEIVNDLSTAVRENNPLDKLPHSRTLSEWSGNQLSYLDVFFLGCHFFISTMASVFSALNRLSLRQHDFVFQTYLECHTQFRLFCQLRLNLRYLPVENSVV